MSEVGFYVCSVLLVISAVAAVALRSFEATVGGGAGVGVSTFLLAFVAGAPVLAVIGLILTAGLLAIVWFAVREKWAAALPAVPWGSAVLATGVGVIALLTTLITFFLAAPKWHEGIQTAGLITLVHYRAPITLGALILLLVSGIAIALFAGRVTSDEVESETQRQSRIERQKRLQRRREDRLAARERRRQARDGAQ